MTTAQISRITPPPSVEAVLGALTGETRIGQVDFTSRLTEPDEAPEDHTDDHTGEASATVPVAASAAPVEADADLDEDSDDSGPGADVVTLKVAEPVREETPEKGTTPARPTRRRLKKAAAAQPSTEDTTDTMADTIADTVGGTAAGTEAPAVEVLEPTLQIAPALVPDEDEDLDVLLDEQEIEDTQDTELVHDQPRRPRLPEPLDVDALLEPSLGIDERPPSIEEIARLVVERMHDAELAMMRHLEAIEVETTRRAELATAQAELDAELIRLNARREAHAIVTAARRRAGQEVEVDPTEAEIEQITESLTRFADVLEELRPSPRPGRPS